MYMLLRKGKKVIRENLSQLFSAEFIVHICIADVSADLHFFTVKGQKLLRCV